MLGRSMGERGRRRVGELEGAWRAEIMSGSLCHGVCECPEPCGTKRRARASAVVRASWRAICLSPRLGMGVVIAWAGFIYLIPRGGRGVG